ncbi:hypothetical protein ECC02_003278 [Trypanosoma cruzi]|uniref:Uncharacterized protein n=1 Tax=Trypanosoma cruzi TaxID=5693 RepID=A0A7J6YAV7_TRYCR|nr:hypothetical protein ECC02_003278 [Trypanosoma cruzi]
MQCTYYICGMHNYPSFLLLILLCIICFYFLTIPLDHVYSLPACVHIFGPSFPPPRYLHSSLLLLCDPFLSSVLVRNRWRPHTPHTHTHTHTGSGSENRRAVPPWPPSLHRRGGRQQPHTAPASPRGAAPPQRPNSAFLPVPCHPHPQQQNTKVRGMPAHSHKRSSTAGPQTGRWVASQTHKRSTARTVRSPPGALSRPAPSHPRAIAEGSANNRRCGPSVPLAGKKAEEMGTCHKHSRQRRETGQEDTK